MRGGAFALAGFVLAACGGDAIGTTTTAATTTVAVTTTTTEASFEVVSDDGVVTVRVPESAMATDPGITIRPMEPDEYPTGLEVITEDVGVVYELGPAGTEFAAPVTVSFRLPTHLLADLEPNEVPLFVLFTTSSDRFEMYGDLTVTRNGTELVVTGTTTHFSPVVLAREATTVVTTIDREEIENGASMRSVADVIELLNEAPGVVPITASLRDSTGAAVAGSPTYLTIDGFPSSTRREGAALDIRCEEIQDIEVLPLSMTTEYGADAVGGVVDLITTQGLFPADFRGTVRLNLNVRLRCLDPATSILGVRLNGFSIATDHPGGTEWIPGEEFGGGLSAALGRLDAQLRLGVAYAGLICDNDADGIIDPTDTMFPAQPIAEMAGRLQFVAPLFAPADYFVYMYDRSLLAALPEGESWFVADGIGMLAGQYNGMGRFESAFGVVSVDGNPFVYTVGSDETELQPDQATLRLAELLRQSLRF